MENWCDLTTITWHSDFIFFKLPSPSLMLQADWKCAEPTDHVWIYICFFDYTVDFVLCSIVETLIERSVAGFLLLQFQCQTFGARGSCSPPDASGKILLKEWAHFGTCQKYPAHGSWDVRMFSCCPLFFFFSPNWKKPLTLVLSVTRYL